MIASARSASQSLFTAIAGSGASAKRKVHEPDFWLIALILTLVMFGIVMVFSSSFAIGIQEDGNSYFFVTRQAIWALIGLTGMTVTALVDYHFWRRFSLPGVIVIMLLLAALVFIPGLGTGGESWGAKRWIDLGPLSFQPSEVAKVVLVIYLADWLGQKGRKIRNFSYGLIPFALLLGLLVGLVMLQPDLGTAILLTAIGVSVFLVAGADLLQLGALIGLGSISFLALALSASYRQARILVFLNPDSDPLGIGYQLVQARQALGSGGFFGLGLGASREKFTWLPAAQNDAIFAVIGEELGLIGCAFVLFLFVLLAWRGYRIATKAPDTFGALVAVGIVTWIIFQAAINIGGITLTIPFTGIPLPFISYGGTALAVSLTAMGILLNISRQTTNHVLVPVQEVSAHQRTLRRKRGGRLRRRPEPARNSRSQSEPATDRWSRYQTMANPRGHQTGSFGRAKQRSARRDG
jgi:cell division protein FtsW